MHPFATLRHSTLHVILPR